MLGPVVVVLALLAGGGWGATEVLGRGDAVDLADVPTELAADPPVTPSDEADDPAAATPVPGATARAASLSAPPVIHATPQLPSDREPLTADLRSLQGRLDALLASLAPSLAGAEVTVAVRDAEGREVFDRHSDRRLLPASTMKSVTAAALLSTLGADHRFTTTASATGEIVDGVLDGDLVLRGDGDPVLSTADYRTHVYPSRPSTSIEDLADAVAETGVKVVTGRVVGDGSGWSNADVAAGWRDEYLDDQNARHVTRLTVDAGLTVRVDVPPDAPVKVELRAADDPVAHAASVFAARLAELGISVRGGATATRLPVMGASPIAAVQSPTVSELLVFTMQRSDNHLADTLLLAAAHAATGDGSWAAANRTAIAVFEQLGVAAAGLRVADGSGLSRLDRVSASQLADLDTAMAAGPDAGTWQASLAVSGQSGTLRNRLVGTAGQGRFLGKTGTLDDVKAVVGHVLPADGSDRRLHLAVVANGAPAGGQWAVTVLMDRLALTLVDQLDGCSTTWDEQGAFVRACAEAS